MHTVLATYSVSSYIKLDPIMYTWTEQDLAVMEDGLFPKYYLAQSQNE